jgi:4-amino-4-deoxy-L-arabinose transferase-like glycosyltransferase
MSPPPPPSRHQRRDTLIVYGALAVVILILGVVLHRSFMHTLEVAVLFFVVTALWSLYRLRTRPPKQ